MNMAQSSDEGVKRVSISLLPDVYQALERLGEQRGFKTRSQAISEMISQSVASNVNYFGNELAAGTITIVYDESRPGLLELLYQIERKYIDEVITSQHVLLENNHTMEVLVVQGPARKLREITDELITCKGVRTGQLALSSIIIPPIHPLTSGQTA